MAFPSKGEMRIEEKQSTAPLAEPSFSVPLEETEQPMEGKISISQVDTDAGRLQWHTVQQISLLELKPLHVRLNPIVVSPVIYPDHQSSRKFSVGLTMNSNLSTLSMRDVGSGPPALTEYDKFYAGSDIRFFFEMELNSRWSGVVRLSYAHLNNESKLRDQMIYDTKYETIDAFGNPVYLTESTIETPLGIYDASIRFRSSGVIANDGDIISNDARIEQRLGVFNISLGSRYTIVHKPRFEVFFGAGAGISNVISSRNIIHLDLFMQDKHLGDMDMNTDKMDKLSQNYFSIHAELGGKYKIQERLHFLLHTGYMNSISSLRERKGAVEPSTFLKQINLGLGLEYQF
jgi:hypothetical protein